MTSPCNPGYVESLQNAYLSFIWPKKVPVTIFQILIMFDSSLFFKKIQIQIEVLIFSSCTHELSWASPAVLCQRRKIILMFQAGAFSKACHCTMENILLLSLCKGNATESQGTVVPVLLMPVSWLWLVASPATLGFSFMRWVCWSAIKVFPSA